MVCSKKSAGKSKDSYEYLRKALELGENAGSQKVVGYACTWLTWACAELGLFTEGIGFGERAQKIAASFPSDQYLFFKSLGGLCFIYWMKGDIRKVFEGGKLLFEYGEKKSNSRSRVFGHWVYSWGHILAGDMKSSQRSCEKAVEVALDPFYAQFPKATLGYAYLFDGQFQETENVLISLLNLSEPRAIGQLVGWSYLFLAPALIAQGHMKKGLNILEKAQQLSTRNQRRVVYGLAEYLFGKTYSQIATGPPPAFSILAQNIGFLMKNAPFAGKKAEEHFNKAIEIFREIGANGFLGMAYLDLGLLYKVRKKTDQARECIKEKSVNTMNMLLQRKLATVARLKKSAPALDLNAHAGAGCGEFKYRNILLPASRI